MEFPTCSFPIMLLFVIHCVSALYQFVMALFKTNVAIKGYDSYFTPSSSEKGGVAIYAKDKLNSFECTDIKMQNIDFESVWIEIENKNSKNIVCGCLYQHPHYDLSEFLHYLEKCLKIIAKENKEVYICGDFNID